VVSVCVGARSPDQVGSNEASYAEAVPKELWAELKADRLLRDDAPTT
jgi:D-threo-aldose 1-dehydrogenase